jgi:hypothetical protein
VVVRYFVSLGIELILGWGPFWAEFSVEALLLGADVYGSQSRSRSKNIRPKNLSLQFLSSEAGRQAPLEDLLNMNMNLHREEEFPFALSAAEVWSSDRRAYPMASVLLVAEGLSSELRAVEPLLFAWFLSVDGAVVLDFRPNHRSTRQVRVKCPFLAVQSCVEAAETRTKLPNSRRILMALAAVSLPNPSRQLRLGSISSPSVSLAPPVE